MASPTTRFVCRTCGGDVFSQVALDQGDWRFPLELGENQDGSIRYEAGEGQYENDSAQADERFECDACGKSADTLEELLRKAT